ncbi:hypothetical protein BH10BAC2_BH10BAC2_39650 [soil metagenome]
MEGLVKEGESIIEDTEEGTSTRDVGLIMAAQKVEHYEIATYGDLHQLAVTMGHDDVSGILEETLNEEKDADQLLTGIAEEHVKLRCKFGKLIFVCVLSLKAILKKWLFYYILNCTV